MDLPEAAGEDAAKDHAEEVLDDQLEILSPSSNLCLTAVQNYI